MQPSQRAYNPYLKDLILQEMLFYREVDLAEILVLSNFIQLCTYIYIYNQRYSIIKSFGFESIPQQLNTNVIRGLVKRAQLLWNVRNRAQLLWFI